MKKYILSYDIRLAGLMEVDALNEDHAIERLKEIDPLVLLESADGESADLIEESVRVEDEVPA